VLGQLSLSLVPALDGQLFQPYPTHPLQPKEAGTPC
jgi:hypothetical protein